MRPEQPARGPRPAFSRAQLTAAAIRIADAEGLDAISMRRLAAEIGSGTMSLYRYVSGKEDLVRLMQDAALTSADTVELPDDWREALRTWAGMIRDAYRAHPWVLEIPRGRLSVLMPASVRAADLGLAAMSGLDLADDEKIAAILLISQHVVSMVELERSLAAEGGPVVTPEGAEALREVVTAEHYPHLAPVMTRGGYIADGEGAEPESVDDEYEFGLDMLIAGLESLARRRGAA